MVASIAIDKNVQPVTQSARKVPVNLEPIVEAKLSNMESKGYICKVEGHAKWQSPIVLAKKKDGDIRICVDMRLANRCVLRENHPMLSIEILAARLGGATCFSKVDIREAFHQIRLDEESSAITTFCTHLGLYRYRVMMFGVSTASETFQRIVDNHILRGLEGVIPQMDDFLIYGETVEIHDARLKALMRRFEDLNVRLNESKCEFRKPEVEFLGHVISREGIRPAESKVAALERFEPPTCKSELKSFLGLLSYVGARCIPNLSAKTEPLRAVLSSEEPFYWGKGEQEAFDMLKINLKEAITLGFYNPLSRTFLYVDAGPSGLGAVLIQKDNEQVNHVVACASRGLSDPEKRYSQSEREALSLLWGVRRFDYYLRGRHFTLVTDHKPLIPIFKPRPSRAPSTSLRLDRWALGLQDYDYELIHCQGVDNIADPFSRLPKMEPTSSLFDDDEEYVWAMAQMSEPTSVSLEEIREQTKSDDTLQKVILALQEDYWPKGLGRYQLCSSELCSLNGLILRGNRIVPPTNLRPRLLDAAHEGHPGVVLMKRRIRQKLWWPNLDSDVEAKVKACFDCQIVSQPNPPEPMSRHPLPDGPWIEVAIDIMGPLPWNISLLVITDYFSRYFEVARLEKCSSTEIISILREVFARWGNPRKMISDNGRQFVSTELKEFCDREGIVLRHSTPYWPRNNGEVERQNRILKKSLTISYQNETDWWAELQRLLIMHRNTPHSVTGKCPAELMMGRQARDKLPSAAELEYDPDVELIDNDQWAKLKGKQYGDRRRQARVSDLEIGDEVVAKRIRKENKLSSTFSPIPYKVTERRGGEVTIEADTGARFRRNVSHVKRINGSKEPNASDTPLDESDFPEPTSSRQFTPNLASTPMPKRPSGQHQELPSQPDCTLEEPNQEDIETPQNTEEQADAATPIPTGRPARQRQPPAKLRSFNHGE